MGMGKEKQAKKECVEQNGMKRNLESTVAVVLTNGMRSSDGKGMVFCSLEKENLQCETQILGMNE